MKSVSAFDNTVEGYQLIDTENFIKGFPIRKTGDTKWA